MSTVGDARKRVKNSLGKDLEAKASDAFCVAFGEAAPAGMFLEAVAPEETQRAAILEIAEPAKKKAALKPAARASFASALRKGVSKAFPRETAHVLRRFEIDRARQEFLERIAPVQGQLERTAGGLLKAAPQDLDPSWRPSPSVQSCWLNRTLRTWASGEALAEVAPDPSVERIDMPHKLKLEMVITTVTMKAETFRQSSGTDGAGVIVAVIDKEVDKDHPALRGRVVQKRNYTQEAWGSPGIHGTAVAGIIAAKSTGFSGIAPGATIYNYKIFQTTDGGVDDFYGARALQDALEDMVDIANCSWGAGPATDGTSREAKACNAAWDLGMIIVKSAGNGGPNPKTLTTPADAEGVIVVGATSREGTDIGSYSSRGPTDDGRKRPHLLAPGGTAAVGMLGCRPGGTFLPIGHGTSYAAPHVAGAAALLLQKSPNLSPAQVRAALVAKCMALAGYGANDQGAGLLVL